MVEHAGKKSCKITCHGSFLIPNDVKSMGLGCYVAEITQH